MPPKKSVSSKAPVKLPAAKSGNIRGPPNKANQAGKKPGPVKKPVVVNKGNDHPVKAPKAKVWTKEDEAARKIQTKMRQYLAKKTLQRRKNEKENYDELMNKLEKEAFVKLVKMEQEQVEKERAKEEAERRRKREEAQRRKRMLEASFDGDNDAILTIFKEVEEQDNKDGIGQDVIGGAVRQKHMMSMVNCEDANNNTALSEAASGGHIETIKLLLDRNAMPNSRGQFNRTPLYRAAFAGHLEACEYLVANGADPRLYADDGQTPEQVASIPPVAEFLASWDISLTEQLLEKLEAAKQRHLDEQKQGLQAEKSKLEDEIEEAKKDFETKQKQLNRAYCELNKRIVEHDKAVAEGFERTDITIGAIQDAEVELEIIKLDSEKAQTVLAQAKLRLREKQIVGDSVNGGRDLPGLKVVIRELDDVLLRDVGNKIKDSGKWPLIIDPSGQTATFLRYRDTNYINALRPSDVEPDKIRLSIIGAIRFGKPVVLDMMDVDMFETCSDRFSEVKNGLMDMIMDQSIMLEESYLPMLKESDGEEYSKTRFNELRTKNFRFFIITKNPYPPDSLMDITYPIRVIIPM